MIFKQLTIQNFRQFAGIQRIKFSTDKNRPVTVLHGFNGAGKTTLLNAFIWLFYGQFSPDFENSDYLENEAEFNQLETNKELTVSVKLIFEDSERSYTAERNRIISKDDTGKKITLQEDKVTLSYIDRDGEVKALRNPKDSLEQLLPKSLYPFFFFNGERIEKLASNQARKEIESGIKVLLDIEVFDRSISHLNGEVARRFRDEVTKYAGEDGKKAREERNCIDESKGDREEGIEQLKKNLQAWENEKEKIDRKLAVIPELAKWQEQRKAKEKELESEKDRLKTLRDDLAKQLSKHSYLILAPDVLSKAQDILDAAHEKRELPVPMKRQFVSELIEEGKCICGQELITGTNYHTEVTQWRDKLPSDELEGEVSITKAKLESLVQRRNDVIAEVDNIQKRRGEVLKTIRSIEEELSELSSKIGDREYFENHHNLESRRKELENLIIETNIAISQNEAEIKKLEKQLQEKDIEIKNLDKVDKKGRLAQRRLNAISNVKLALEQIRQLQYNRLNIDLSDRLGEIWNKIAIKDYTAKIDKNYHLQLTKKIDGIERPVRGTSTGEKQVLSLAFIGSLVDKACAIYNNTNSSNKHLFKGGLYPLVIDSAFGQLELSYKRDVAKWMPTLAPQLIILVSESQWKTEVEEALQLKIGSEWILQCSTLKRREKNIILHGREYRYVVLSDDGFEKTKITEVQVS